MNDADLDKIEAKLKLQLPNAYRTMMRTTGERIVAAYGPDKGMATIFASIEQIVSANKEERRPKSETRAAFPKWWETFFLFGTNGAGDYFCLRLDGKPGVWVIGTDCGDTPSKVDKSLAAFVAESLPEKEKRREEEAKRQAECADETAAELKAIAAAKSPQAKAWMEAKSTKDLFGLLGQLGRRLHPDKLRRFGVACCRLLPGLDKDKDCVAALDLVQRAMAGEVSWDKAATLRQKLTGKKRSPVARAGLAAVASLLEDDETYRRGKTPDGLESTADHIASALGANGIEPLAKLLREVVGNPWLARFPPKYNKPSHWLALAGRIDSTGRFEDMPKLARMLEHSRIEPRFAAHCNKSGAHVRGCWVVDELLGRETFLQPVKKFEWHFEWPHPSIAPKKLKVRLEELAEEIDADDVGARLAFGKWLDKNGDAPWAEFIRVRTALDRNPPGDDYVDLREQWAEVSAYFRIWNIEIPGFYFSGYQFHHDEWWEKDAGDFEAGLPGRVTIETSSSDGGSDALLPQLDALTSQTPIRGLEVEDEHIPALPKILMSPGGRRFRSLDLDYGWDNTSLAEMGFDRALASVRLQSLRLSRKEYSQENLKTLAKSSLKGLSRLALNGGAVSGKTKAGAELLSAQWFNDLQWLEVGFDQDGASAAAKALVNMKRLHTLVLRRPSQELIAAVASAGALRSLRRLVLIKPKLSIESCRDLCNWKLPKLVELWIERCDGKPKDAAILCEAEYFSRLQALTIHGKIVDKAWLEALAASPCAGKLRFLHLECGDSDLEGRLKSLGDTALARPHAFPSLTTLSLKNPYAKKVKRDTAKMLANFASENLRHLLLDDTSFDDACAEALTSHPAFAKLTRLFIEPGFSGEGTMLSPKAAERMFRSENLANMVELHIDHVALGSAPDAFRDHTVMPHLRWAVLSDEGIAEKKAKQLEKDRPQLRIC